jgi:hypothetical protein
MQLLPGTPETAREWVILLVLGPPAWLLLEWGASRIVGVKSGASASSAPISATRILKGLAVALVVIAPLVLWALRRAP